MRLFNQFIFNQSEQQLMNRFILIMLLIANYTLHAQEQLAPTEDLALLHVSVANMEFEPRPNDKIIFEGQATQASFEGVSNKEGKFQILLPEGDVYLIKIQGLGNQIDFDKVNIPKQQGIIQGEIAVRYRPEKSFNLDDVHFETAKSKLLSSSFPTLDELVAVLELKPDLRLEIAGHTDNVGNDASNLKLSQDRAQAVVNYLVKKGIAAERLEANGYGEQAPIASNETEEGRQENRRTEARIL